MESSPQPSDWIRTTQSIVAMTLTQRKRESSCLLLVCDTKRSSKVSSDGNFALGTSTLQRGNPQIRGVCRQNLSHKNLTIPLCTLAVSFFVATHAYFDLPNVFRRQHAESLVKFASQHARSGVFFVVVVVFAFREDELVAPG